jgi:hypothetical protein
MEFCSMAIKNNFTSEALDAFSWKVIPLPLQLWRLMMKYWYNVVKKEKKSGRIDDQDEEK